MNSLLQPSRKVIIIIFAVNYFLPLFVASVQFAIKWWAWTNSFYIGNSYNWSSYGFDHLLYWANALRAFQTQKKSDRKHSTSCKFFFNRKKGYGTSWSVKNYTKYILKTHLTICFDYWACRLQLKQVMYF